MTRMISKLCLCLIFVGISGACGSQADHKDLDKDEARDRVEKGADTDYCELYDWYDDGQCDSFCEHPDPDCGVQCAAIPVCPPSMTEVDICDVENNTCTTIEECGSSIYCVSDTFCDAVPTCPDGYVESSCDPDDEDCELETLCGQTIRCERSPGMCLAIPTCPEGFEQVDECMAAAGAECLEVAECGQTIICQEPIEQCDAYPVCPDGTHEVDQCDPDGDTCQTASICGSTIYCEDDPIDCLAEPTCEEGYDEVDECPTDVECYEETVCGRTIACLKVP